MKTILIIILICSSLVGYSQRAYCDTFWAPYEKYDTVEVQIEDFLGKVKTAFAIFQHGQDCTGKDKPRVIAYLQTNRRLMISRPRKIRWDKMTKDAS